MSQSSGPSSSEIDDLIQQAVSSKDFVQQPCEPLSGAIALPEPGAAEEPRAAEAHDAVQSAISEAEQAPTPENREEQESHSSLGLQAISDDFFIRPISSRKGRD